MISNRPKYGWDFQPRLRQKWSKHIWLKHRLALGHPHLKAARSSHPTMRSFRRPSPRLYSAAPSRFFKWNKYEQMDLANQALLHDWILENWTANSGDLSFLFCEIKLENKNSFKLSQSKTSRFLQRDAHAGVFFSTPGAQRHHVLLGRAAAAAGASTQAHHSCGDHSGTRCADVWRRTRCTWGSTGSSAHCRAGCLPSLVTEFECCVVLVVLAYWCSKWVPQTLADQKIFQVGWDQHGRLSNQHSF